MPKSFFNEKGKIVLESKEQPCHRRIKSPEYADAPALTSIPDSSFTQAGFYNMFLAHLARQAAEQEREAEATE